MMENRERANRLCLGTVQFGMDYGINNQKGKPRKDEVFAMLDYALSNGIDCLDTAAVYGEAEILLGHYGIGQKKEVKVVSKLQPELIWPKYGDVAEQMAAELKKSLDRLQIESLDGFLLHNASDFYRDDIVEGLLYCRDQGLVRHCGVSVYSSKDALRVVQSGTMDYIQVPYNIWDRRLEQSAFFSEARKRGVTVFARSAFLQGLIVMEEEKIPNHLGEVRCFARKLTNICEKYGYSRSQAAFLYVYTHPGIDYLVFGVDHLGQLVENIRMTKNEIIKEFFNCRRDLEEAFHEGAPEYIVCPHLWRR